MTEQIEMPFDLDSDDLDWERMLDGRWEELLETVRQAANRIERKQVAADLDVKRTVLDSLLANRERHKLKARQLIYFVMRDRGVIEHLCRMAGGRFEPDPVMTPAEELAALKKVLRDQGEVGRHLLGLVKGGTR
jgi:hypothetical protein